MAFGQELKDFVNGFQAGYKMIDSPEEKEEKREIRRMRKEQFERTGQWREEDQAYRRERDSVEDTRWGTSRNDRLREQGAQQGRWESDQDFRNRSLQLESDKLKLGLAKDAGTAETGRMDKYMNRAIPDGDTSDEGASLQPTAGNAAPNEWLRYANNGAIRNKPLSPKLETAMGKIANDLGVEVEVFSGGQSGSRRTGSKRHDHGDAADVFFYKDGRKLDWNDPKDRPVFEEIVKRGKSVGLTGFGAGPGYMQAGSMHVGYGTPSVWGAGGKSANAPEWLRNAYSGGSQQVAQQFARGGAVEAIPSDEEAPMTDMQEASGLFTIAVDEGEPTQLATALPEEGPVPSKRPSYEGVTEGTSDEPTDDPWEQGRRAVRDGLKQAIAKTGADKDSAIADPELEKIRQQYIRGYGAAPAQMMRQVIDKIDPNREMPAGERNIKAMGTVYQYYLDQGDLDKAKEAAASMVQYYRRTSQQFLALGQAAAEKGDIDNAAKAMIAAYANVPNGRDMSVEKNKDGNYTVTVTDARTGKPVNRVVASPRDIAAQAMNFNPATFDDEILNAAGVAPEKYDNPSLENMGTVEENVKTYVDESLVDSGLPPKAISTIQDVAASIASTKENRMGPEQAARFAAGLTAFDSSNPNSDKPNYTSKPVRGNPDYVEVTMNGQSAVMTKSQFNNLTGLRGSMEKERKTSRDAEKASAEKRAQQMDYLKKGVDAFGGAINDANTEMQQNENIQRNASDIGAMGGKMMRQTAIPDEQPALSEKDKELLQRLIEARQNALSKPDPERYGLSEIEARLRELGWSEKE
jgi:hypothetical protein